MDTTPISDKLKTAIADELGRQAANSGGALKVETAGDGRIRVEGPVDLDDLVMVVTGSVAGGP